MKAFDQDPWVAVTVNPFSEKAVVTSLGSEDAAPQRLYEKVYCVRGDMENRIKECQLDLFADRTSAATIRANRLRLWFASMAMYCCAPVARQYRNILVDGFAM
jgi:hypothetical protein